MQTYNIQQPHSSVSLSNMTDIMAKNDVFINLGSDTIVVTTDKIELALTKHLQAVEMRRNWQRDGGIFLTLVLTFATSNFKTVFGIPATVVHALFIFLMLFFLFRTCLSLYRWVCSDKMGADEILEELKRGGSPNQVNLNIAPKEGPMPLSALLTQNEWFLTFDVMRPSAGKEILFNEDGKVSKGQNKNEYEWYIRNGLLHILNSSGMLFSKFQYIALEDKFISVSSNGALLKNTQSLTKKK